MQNIASESGKAQSSKANANSVSGAGKTYAPPAYVFGEGYSALTDAVAENGDSFFVRADETAYPTLGFTTTIREHDGPEIEFNEEERDTDQWYVRPTKSSDAQMAAQIIAAENEHVADYRYAAANVLDVADAWLGANLNQLGPNNDGEFGPAGSEDDAIALAEAAIDPALKAAIGLTGVADFTWANIGAYYRHAADQTQKRDENDWHSFDSDETVHDDRVNKTTTAGATEIGTHGSADVIDLTEVTD
jgi:hypothetical protein